MRKVDRQIILMLSAVLLLTFWLSGCRLPPFDEAVSQSLLDGDDDEDGGGSPAVAAFVTTWQTDAAGDDKVSADNEIQLPLDPGGICDFTVDWGDGTSDVITSCVQPETRHT